MLLIVVAVAVSVGIVNIGQGFMSGLTLLTFIYFTCPTKYTCS